MLVNLPLALNAAVAIVAGTGGILSVASPTLLVLLLLPVLCLRYGRRAQALEGQS